MSVLVIAKAPVAGKVKTRLCPPCTSEQAAEIATAALRDTLDAVVAAAVGRRVVVLEGETGPWIPAGFDVVPQVGGGLGRRLEAAMVTVGGPTVVVGMDTPHVGSDGIDAAAQALCADGCDGVLGRALDGGYWAIGLRGPIPGAFDGVPMSRDDTAAHQIRRLVELGQRITELHELRDIDHWPDALAIAERHPRLRTAAAVDRVRLATAT